MKPGSPVTRKVYLCAYDDWGSFEAGGSMSNLVPFEFEVVTVNAQGHVRDRSTATVQAHLEELAEGILLELVAIPGGTFLMGAPSSEEGWSPSQSPQHSVTVPSFFLGKYPVTQGQWQAVAMMPKVNCYLDPTPACIAGADRPVEQISWEAAIEFCARLAQQTGRPYRLPSEAEWEYACRAGTLTPFHFGDTITTDLANYSGIDWDYMGKICSRGSYGAGPKGDDRKQTTPVDYFPAANKFGLYDMHGNVREWCLDVWHDSYTGAPSDGSAWVTDEARAPRVLRGGSWNTSPAHCRSAFRTRFEADSNLYDIGFRVALSREVRGADNGGREESQQA